MKIGGFQKMTLLDFPGKVACTVFTQGCNFRCPFCHNAGLVTADEEEIGMGEIISFLEKRITLLDGVCVTGGEPLLHTDIDVFLKNIKDMGFAVKLDTNGSFPDRLRHVIDEGLVDMVAMDIKNAPSDYAKTIGIPDYDITPVRKSVDILLGCTIPYEFRTTVVAQYHTVDSIRQAAKWIRGAERYYLQNFVDSGNLLGDGLTAVDKNTLFAMREAAKEFVPNTELRGI